MAGILSVQQIQGLASAADPTTVTIPSGHNLIAPGHVVQTVMHEFTDNTTTSTNYTYVDAAGSSVTITTKQANSKIYLFATCQSYCTGTCNGANIAFKRGGTLIAGVNGSAGDSWRYLNGNTIANNSMIMKRQYLDAPAVAAGTSLTYNIGVSRWTAGTVQVNYANYNMDSHFLIQEIAQ